MKKLPAFFYESPSGNSPVRDWILKQTLEDRHIIGRDIQKVEFGWPLGMPYCRSLGNGNWEVRCDLTQGTIGRILFCIHEERMVLLHGYMKKTRKTPDEELKLALKRKKELE